MRPVKNKKRIDPRYFLEETVLKEDVEQELEEGWLPSWLGGKTDEEEYDEKSADVYKARRAKGMEQAPSGEWYYKDKKGASHPYDRKDPQKRPLVKKKSLPGHTRTDQHLKSVEGEGALKGDN